MTGNAQTNVDFLIGMSVFLLGVGFVFGLVPNVFEPFTIDGSANALVADRGAAHLAEGMLGDPSTPAVLDETCTEAFFAGTAPAGCRFTETDPGDALGLPDSTRVNVTIERGGAAVLDTGEPVPDRSANVVAARRVVSLDGETSYLYVRVW